MSTQTHERIPELTLGWRLKMALGEDSVQEMAEYLGVSRATLSRWMGDKGAPPKRAYVNQWALKTGVDRTWLESGIVPSGGDGDGIPVTYRYRRALAPVTPLEQYRRTTGLDDAA